MCGINGLYDLKKTYETDKSWLLVHEMNEKIVHRGPNHEGMFQDENFTMGMRRLAILDLKSGNQPIYNENKNLVVTYNGEIYNFQELKQELELKEHKFYTDSDTEVIVHAYEEFGEKVFEKLDGMYAIAIFDKTSRKLILARDRMGEKPLYYYKDENFFIWGSEIKSLLGTNIPNKTMNKEALNQYLQLTYIPAPLTIYENIYKLLPGHYLIIEESGMVRNREYWNLKNIRKNLNITYEEAKEKLQHLLKESVEKRMISDVPLGAFLSGGIDSSTIVSLMADISETPIETFTIGFNEKEYDERNRARLVADMYHTNHHEKVLDYNEVLKSIDVILDALDEPFADSSALPSYFVSKFAAEHVKVVLTGDAGDELFLGYSKYLISYYSELYHKFPKWMQSFFKNIIMLLPDKSTLTRKMRKVLNCVEKDIFEQRRELMSLGFKEEERKALLKTEFYNYESMNFVEKVYRTIEDGTEWSKTQYTDLTVVLEGDMLVKVDRMSMLHSIETRTPLLSKDIVEFAFSIPDEYKIRRKSLKCIMKDTFADILPENFTKFSKSGFAIPLDYWFRNQLKDLVEKLLNQEFILKQGIFNYDYIQKILEEHYSGKVNRKSEIWTLIVFQKWYLREFLS